MQLQYQLTSTKIMHMFQAISYCYIYIYILRIGLIHLAVTLREREIL